MKKLFVICTVLLLGGYIAAKVSQSESVNVDVKELSEAVVEEEVRAETVESEKDTEIRVVEKKAEVVHVKQEVDLAAIQKMSDAQLQDEITYLTREIEFQEVTRKLNEAKDHEHNALVAKWRPVFEKLTYMRAENFQRQIHAIAEEVSQLEKKYKSESQEEF